MSEQRRAMLEQTIQHQVKLVLAAPVKIGSQQIGHRTLVIPLAMAAPFAAWSNQPVSRGNLEQARPVGALAGRWEFFRPELIQAQLPPKITGQPAGAVLARTAQLIVLQAQ